MTDVRTSVGTAQKTKLDGVEGISKQEYAKIKDDYRTKPQSAASVKWLQTKHPALHAAITSDLNYSGYVGTAIGSLNSTRAGGELKADAGRRADRQDKLPPLRDYKENGMPKSVKDAGSYVGKDENGTKVTAYKTGGNTTNVKEGNLQVSDDEAKKSRQAQKDYTAKMSGIIGADVSNPPSVNAAKGYFKTLAKRGASSKEIQAEYKDYLKTFYKHPGGVSWSGGKPDPANLDKQFKDQPIAKDGKRLIDCEGYSALTESVMGDLKKPNGQKMFDVLHASPAGHVVTGVFPRGGDQRDGFVVDNHNVRSVRPDPRSNKDYAATKTESTRRRFLLRTYTQGAGWGAPRDWGDTISNMMPLEDKLKLKK